MPNHRINAFAWMDRELFTEEIDRQHYPAGLFDGFAFWILAGAYYLPNWMEYWVRRYGKQASPYEKALAARQHPGDPVMGRPAFGVRAGDGIEVDSVIKLNPGNIDEHI